MVEKSGIGETSDGDLIFHVCFEGRARGRLEKEVNLHFGQTFSVIVINLCVGILQ